MLEFHMLIQSHTALDHFKLNGQVPESVMWGETVDISWLAQFKWYDSILYNEPTTSFPEDNVRLGHYLGPTSAGKGSTMQGKILNENGQEITHVMF